MFLKCVTVKSLVSKPKMADILTDQFSIVVKYRVF